MLYLPYVNTKMGTKSHPRRSYGNTLPLTQLPFGMASFCLQTEVKRAWFYQPDHEFAEGVRLTHQFSPWIGDYGAFLLMPQNDCVANTGEGAWSGIRKDRTEENPHYFKTFFTRSNCVFELTPTERGGAIRLTFMDDRPSFLSLLPVMGNYSYRCDAKTNTVYGETDGHALSDAKNFKTFMVIRFLGDAVDGERTYPCGEGTSACIHIALKKREVEARIGISYISYEMAEAAIDRECGELSFDEIKAQAEANWEEKLGRIEIEALDDTQMKTFYSCLYRTFLFPRKAYEIDANGEAVHYVPFDGSVKPGVRYTDNCFWDTYRTLYPLFTLIAREEFTEILEGLVTDYADGGWLPRCSSMGEVGCMPSTLIDAVIAEAAVNGIGTKEVLEKALEGMIYHATLEAEDPRYGRNGAISFLKYGYVPRNEHRESVNLTQDFAYGDWCIARVAEVLGHADIAEEYDRHATYYRNLFDPQTGFMRGKDDRGNMAADFDPFTWGGEYTEGSAWQNSFAVPHDVEGLAELHGGREALIAKLDELFSTPPRYRVMGYGFEIHEMTEMAMVDFGQMAISNQPSFHIPFIYAALGEIEKTEYCVKRLTEEAFFPTDDGYPGDEDTGTTSAWYILSVLGMYRLCPGKDEWIRFKPSVNHARICGKDI
jgi:predicted alpha-1,2-mannosidase